MAAMKPPKPTRAAAETPSQAPPTFAIQRCDQSASRANKKAPMPTTNTSAILIPDSTEATLPLTLTARQLIPVTIRIEARATTWILPNGTAWPKTFAEKNSPSNFLLSIVFRNSANCTPRAACDPALPMKKDIQPNRNPATTYTPRTLPGVPTLQVITRAFRKTPVPITLPTTTDIAATSVRPRTKSSFEFRVSSFEFIRESQTYQASPAHRSS